MKEIAIEDIATVFASEFVKEYKGLLKPRGCLRNSVLRLAEIPFLKMNYARRRKLVEKFLDKMEKDIHNS